jgi:hypothetical protein
LRRQSRKPPSSAPSGKLYMTMSLIIFLYSWACTFRAPAEFLQLLEPKIQHVRSIPPRDFEDVAKPLHRYKHGAPCGREISPP